MRSGKGLVRAMFGLLGFLGVIWFLYAGILGEHVTTTSVRTTSLSTEAFEHWNLITGDQHVTITRRDWSLHYVSKRRVPNGPDPIHNRRASQSRQPPGRY